MDTKHMNGGGGHTNGLMSHHRPGLEMVMVDPKKFADMPQEPLVLKLYDSAPSSSSTSTQLPHKEPQIPNGTGGGGSISASSSTSDVLSMVSNASTGSGTSCQQQQQQTKIQFYDMMISLLRSQLANCDSAAAYPVSLVPIGANGSMDNDDDDHLKPMPGNEEMGSTFPRLRDSQGRPYMLQPSLFPLQHPTVFFTTDDDFLSTVPNEIRSFLRWKLTTITANTMKAIVQRSGYRLIALDKLPTKKSFSNWNAIWCKHLKVGEFGLVGYHQRVNHFPGSFNFGRKDRLWLNLKAKADKFGHDVFGSFHPRTFILPGEYGQLVEFWQQSDEEFNVSKKGGQFGQNRKVFICKPPASARGQGINIVSTVEELNQLMTVTLNSYLNPPAPQGATIASSSPSSTVSMDSEPGQASVPVVQKAPVAKKPPKVQLVVQEYIANPCLLANSAKFDLRVYVLVTSISPLRLYVYEEGIVRFASNRYSKSLDDIKNQFIHLTNYSVNKNCVEYVPSQSTDSQDGHKWTLRTLWRHLGAMQRASGDRRALTPQQIWSNVIDLIIKTVISAESQILNLLKQHLKNKRSCFELLGFDIMLDEQYKLWLLEVNITPSLRADSVLDFSVKNELVKDILNTIGYQLSPRFRKFYNFGSHLAPDKADLLNTMKTPNEEKHRKYETLYLQEGADACRDIIDDLNDDDLCQLMEAEDELHRAGQFRRIFPAPNSAAYLGYFDFPYYYNLLLISWEQRYGDGKRQEAIARLRSQMLAKDAVAEMYEKLKTQVVPETEKSVTVVASSSSKQGT